MLNEDKTQRFLKAIAPLAPGSDLTVLSRHEPDPEAKPNECYTNCRAKVARSGGSIQYGCTFAGELSLDYVIATGHAVWRSPDGDFIDITPRLPMDNLPNDVVPPLVDTDGNLFFLPHDKAHDRPNIFLPLTKNKALVRACRQCSRKEWRLRRDPAAVTKRFTGLKKLYEDGLGQKHRAG
jgi:hypothetical protein